MRIALALVVLTGGAAGLMLAPPRSPSPLAAMSKQPAAIPAAPVPARTPAAPVASIARDPDGHFRADAAINGRPVRVLVDTGASTVALTPEDARAAGLSVDPGRWHRIGLAASGPARGERLTLASVTLGGIQRMDVEAVVVDGLPVSLLGQSFLRRLEAVEIRGDQMTLK